MKGAVGRMLDSGSHAALLELCETLAEQVLAEHECDPWAPPFACVGVAV